MEDLDLQRALDIVSQLRACGHYLYYRMGGRTGRRRILTALARHPNLPQKELQELLYIQSGSLSEIIIKLEADGLVEKVRSETDGRQWNLRLTPQGQTEAARREAAYERQVSEMMACFSTQERMQLHRLLDTMLCHWNTVAAVPIQMCGEFQDE